MKDTLKLIEKELGDVRVKFDESLKYHLASGSAASAQCFYIATTIKELTDALDLTRELKIPFFLFGAGTKILISGDVEGLTIKNRTSGIKISGVKGKVSVNGIGVAEAMVEVESGVSLQKTNEFLKDQKLKQFNFPYIPNATIGGSLYVTPPLQDMVQKIKVWSEGEISDIEVYELKSTDIVLSVIIKVKAADEV
jgi:UDP-N-acetylenolpyruvoylglucosamine reductase